MLKMADQGRSDFYVVFTGHESLCTWIKTIVNKFAISNHMTLILRVHALRSYLKLICEYELHSFIPDKKLVVQRIMLKTTSRSNHPWSAIFCITVYSVFLSPSFDTMRHVRIFHSFLEIMSVVYDIEIETKIVCSSH